MPGRLAARRAWWAAVGGAPLKTGRKVAFDHERRPDPRESPSGFAVAQTRSRLAR